MSSRANIVIVGGGVIGLTTAYLLAKAGVASIVLDQSELGKEASWAGAGIIPACDVGPSANPLDELRSLSVSRLAAFSAELYERTGVDNGYRRTGGLEFADANDPPAEDEWCGGRSEYLDEAAAARLEPALNRGLGPVRHLPDMAQIRNPRHLEALVAACTSMNGPEGWPLVDLRPGVGATSLLRDGNRIEAVATTNSVVEGDRFLIAAGAWTAGLLRPLGWTLPIEPVRGQMVLLNPGQPLLRHILLCGSRYLVPRPEGRILVGSTVEYAGFHKQTTAIGVQGLLELATRLVPDLAIAAVEKTWSGLRPGSRDGLPYMGRVGDVDNLFVAAGHFRAGLQLSLGTGLVMADVLQGKAPPMEIAAFDSNR